MKTKFKIVCKFLNDRDFLMNISEKRCIISLSKHKIAVHGDVIKIYTSEDLWEGKSFSFSKQKREILKYIDSSFKSYYFQK